MRFSSTTVHQKIRSPFVLLLPLSVPECGGEFLRSGEQLRDGRAHGVERSFDEGAQDGFAGEKAFLDLAGGGGRLLVEGAGGQARHSMDLHVLLYLFLFRAWR